MDDLDLDVYELHFLVTGAFRYALGRQTYLVDYTINFLKKNWERLDSSIQDIIIMDLKREIETHERMMDIKNYSDLDDGWVVTNLGSKYDIISWIKFSEWINEKNKENV